MALVLNTLYNDILDVLNSTNNTKEQAAMAIATAVDSYIKSGDIAGSQFQHVCAYTGAPISCTGTGKIS